ncbi:hypothetical protein F5888DRAFT_1820572 [Russula emetica]|nr:hypothetical protein F5888DRAFT_1820572 [Russula emetica]
MPTFPLTPTIPLEEEQQRDVFAGDHQGLTADPTIYTPSSDGRLFGFLPYRTGIAPTFRHDAIIIGPRPHPQTPSQATAVQQHQQQLAQQQQSAPARASQSPRSPPVSAPSPNEIDKINNNTVPSLPHSNPRQNHPLTPPKFLKPAGVDEPPSDSVARRDGSRPARQREADIINHGTQRCQNPKRHRDDRRGASSGGHDGGVSGALTSDRDTKGAEVVALDHVEWGHRLRKRRDMNQSSPVPPSLNGSEESHSSSTPGDNVLQTYKDTLANSEHSYLSKARSFDCMDEENDEAIATLRQRAWAALRAKVNEQTVDTAILTKLRTYFKECFCYDEHATPAGVTAASPMPIKPTQPHAAIHAGAQPYSATNFQQDTLIMNGAAEASTSSPPASPPPAVLPTLSDLSTTAEQGKDASTTVVSSSTVPLKRFSAVKINKRFMEQNSSAPGASQPLSSSPSSKIASTTAKSPPPLTTSHPRLVTKLTKLPSSSAGTSPGWTCLSSTMPSLAPSPVSGGVSVGPPPAPAPAPAPASHGPPQLASGDLLVLRAATGWVLED